MLKEEYEQKSSFKLESIKKGVCLSLIAIANRERWKIEDASAAAKYCERWRAQVRKDFGELADSPAADSISSSSSSSRSHLPF